MMAGHETSVHQRQADMNFHDPTVHGDEGLCFTHYLIVGMLAGEDGASLGARGLGLRT